MTHMIHLVSVRSFSQYFLIDTHAFYFGDGGYQSGYVTTSVVPGRRPLGFGGANPLGLGNQRLGLPPKVRVIFVPQGGVG